MPLFAKYVDPADSRPYRTIHISEVREPQDWRCIACDASMLSRCQHSDTIRPHFAHDNNTEHCAHSGETDRHALLKRWMCQHWRSVLMTSCRFCNKRYLPQGLDDCTADIEVLWKDKKSNTVLFADVGLKNIRTDEVAGCVEVVHTHYNTRRKKNAIHDAVCRGTLVYIEVHPADIDGLVDVDTPYDDVRIRKLKRQSNDVYCSAECRLSLAEERERGVIESDGCILFDQERRARGLIKAAGEKAVKEQAVRAQADRDSFFSAVTHEKYTIQNAQFVEWENNILAKHIRIVATIKKMIPGREAFFSGECHARDIIQNAQFIQWEDNIWTKRRRIMKSSRKGVYVDVDAFLPPPYTSASEFEAAVLRYHGKMSNATRMQQEELSHLKHRYGITTIL